MTSDVRVRPAVATDVGWLAEVSRASFASRLHPFLISAQPGIDRFWEVVLSHPAAFPGRSFLVAETDEDGRIGFVDLQVVDPGTAHLSYVCVTEPARGRGVAGTLLRDYLHRNPDVVSMQLDVFDDNASARALYDRLGFESVATTTWWVADLPRARRAAAGTRVQGLHAATAWLDTYGFAELAVAVDDAIMPLARPSRSVLRCPDPALLLQPAVLAAVVDELPELSEVLVTLEGDEPPPSDIGPLRQVNRSIRMTASDVRTRWEPM
ncbi:GNAT family N-acetyltransferase [Nocardioides oleivorans]|uniref:GNAT family N-acetyltransferase n=1 Tax=Nocardioides oleivorans TaxID=273676 RepID=A0A4Q2RYE1_9ACTN|nr:GNAT family N-acetyltransferase [Nocardioides oleivorans]RYB94300.1 GNAT family N-acetyltransferase [Nocardioides oleivorans]